MLKDKYNDSGMNKETEALFSDQYVSEGNPNITVLKVLETVTKQEFVFMPNIILNNETGFYEYPYGNPIIRFKRISDEMNDGSLKNELLSDKRYHQCHLRSLMLSHTIPGSKITTGYIYTGNKKILHSVVESNNLIYDWTKNLKMPREDYMKITLFEPVASFEGDKFLEDVELILGNIMINLKVYLTFRDELMKDLEKNKQLFNLYKQDESSTEEKEHQMR